MGSTGELLQIFFIRRNKKKACKKGARGGGGGGGVGSCPPITVRSEGLFRVIFIYINLLLNTTKHDIV